MSTREEFEKWWLRDVPEEHRAFAKKLLDGYGPDYSAAPGVADAWSSWQASWAVALEAAAKSIEPSNMDTPSDWTEYAQIKAEAAETIRALAKQGE